MHAFSLNIQAIHSGAHPDHCNEKANDLINKKNNVRIPVLFQNKSSGHHQVISKSKSMDSHRLHSHPILRFP